MSVKPEFKIVADHLRSSCFLVADGVLPSNEGRGYVLRRIMRRAMRQLHKLGASGASMYKLVDPLIREMGAAFPELGRAREVIIETLKNEEEKFRETLEKGLKILEEELSTVTLSLCETDSDLGVQTSPSHKLRVTNPKFSGATAFKLYDTYGFPLDLTQDILKEKNIEVDLEEFNCEMEKQRNLAKANWKGSGEVADDKIFFDLKEKFGFTKFLGYENLSAKAKVLAAYPNFLILDQTPFYATSGGQVGDDGKIISKHGEVEIIETKKFAGGLFVHFFKDKKGEINVGDEVEANVNPHTRQMRANNHSATHLMHKALKEVIGNSISQKGSNVDVHGFTFDFNFNRAMTPEEIKKVEDLVNAQIKNNSDVSTKLMGLDQARESGAEALFGEKYDAEVRVVAMGNSIELCGGTHVKNTSDIEIFKIISEKSIASGIRRIEAKSAILAKEYLAQQEEKAKNYVRDLIEKINKKSDEISALGGEKSESTKETDAKILEEILKKKDKEIERLKKQSLLADLGKLQPHSLNGATFFTHKFENVDAGVLRDAANELLKKSDLVALFGTNDGKVSLCVAVSPKSVDKFDATKLIQPMIAEIGGKGGGGKKDFAMGGGTNAGGISQAIEVLTNLIK
jgi:alanyl-tRNA synthetase